MRQDLRPECGIEYPNAKIANANMPSSPTRTPCAKIFSDPRTIKTSARQRQGLRRKGQDQRHDPTFANATRSAIGRQVLHPDIETLNDKYSFPDAKFAENHGYAKIAPRYPITLPP